MIGPDGPADRGEGFPPFLSAAAIVASGRSSRSRLGSVNQALPHGRGSDRSIKRSLTAAARIDQSSAPHGRGSDRSIGDGDGLLFFHELQQALANGAYVLAHGAFGRVAGASLERLDDGIVVIRRGAARKVVGIAAGEPD